MNVQEFDHVVLKKDANWKIFQVIKHKQIYMCKMKFYLDGVVGHQFGSTFKVEEGHLVKLSASQLHDDDTIYDKDEAAEDNRDLVDDRDNQRMTKDEIQALHKDGASGEEIIGHLIENSATFSKKTEFSQQKYVQKKRKKHVAILMMLKPNTRNLVQLYYSRGPTKICNLRIDSLAQILTQSNVHAGCKVLVIESCTGLVVGAVMERMGGLGSLVHLYTGTAPNRPAVTDGFRFPDEWLQNLHSFPLNEVDTLCRKCLFDVNSLSSSQNVTTTNPSQQNVNNTISSISKASSESMVLGEDSMRKLHHDELIHNLSTSTMKIKRSVPVDMNSTKDLSIHQHFIEEKPDDEKISMNCEGDELTDVNLTRFGINQSGKSKRRHDNKKKPKKSHEEDPEERERRRELRLEQIQRAKSVIEAANMDCLIVASKFYPTPIVLNLLDFVAPSRPIVVFSQFKEPLLDCFLKLKASGRVLMIKLSETWLRGYQVLPDRTHPSINTSGSGGYLLTAMTVEPPK